MVALETEKMLTVIDKERISFSTNKNGKFNTIELDNSIKSAIEYSKPITLTWENINVNLKQKDKNCCAKLPCFKQDVEKTHIIQDVNGIAQPFKILAIMGASGAGKTTLLNVLNFRNGSSFEISGDVKVNGQQITSSSALSSISGYVQQDDLFIGSLKVKEHLLFQAMLRLDKSISREDKLNRIEKIMNDLNLKKCEDTLIGIPEKGLKGISGGEKRRLAFASEIITNPAILFCDEPTSGLDSFMALSVVDSMKKLASQGKTIICTIHQPSSEIFEMFDRLCLLSEGRLAYIGDLDKAYDFFSSEGFTCPRNYNPADFYIHKLAIMPSEKEESKARSAKICDGFEKSDYMAQLKSDIEVAHQEKTDFFVSKKQNYGYKTNIFTQIYWLLFRNLLSVARDPFLFKMQIIQAIMLGILFGLIYFRLEMNQTGVQNINGLLFLFVTNSSFSYLFPVVNTFPAEIPIFLRDYHNGMYRVISYYLSKILVDLPNYLILPAVFFTICYWMSNFDNDFKKYLIAVCIVILVAQSAVSFGTFLSAIAPSTNAAIGMSGPLMVPLMIFSGFFLNNASIPSYFIWLRYISWFNYANELLLINQWSDVDNIPCNNNQSICFYNGDNIINALDMDKSNFWRNLGLMFAVIVSYRTLAYIVLVVKSKRR